VQTFLAFGVCCIVASLCFLFSKPRLPIHTPGEATAPTLGAR
jgi:hypothetical protein